MTRLSLETETRFLKWYRGEYRDPKCKKMLKRWRNLALLDPIGFLQLVKNKNVSKKDSIEWLRTRPGARDYGFGSVGEKTLYLLRAELGLKNVGIAYQFNEKLILANDLTPEFLWALGVIAADGSVLKSAGNAVSISSKDPDLLEKLREILMVGDAPIFYEHSREQYKWFKLTISSKKFAEFLISIGMGEDKMTHLQVPDYIFFSPHFLRGIFDGDGCIQAAGGKRTSPRLHFVSVCEETIKRLQIYFEMVRGAEVRIYPNTVSKRSLNIEVTGNTARAIIAEVWADTETGKAVGLARKVSTAQEIIHMCNRHQVPVVAIDDSGVETTYLSQVSAARSVRSGATYKQIRNTGGDIQKSAKAHQMGKKGKRVRGYRWRYATAKEAKQARADAPPLISESLASLRLGTYG